MPPKAKVVDMAHLLERAVPSGDCIVWLRAKNQYGYGVLGVGGRAGGNKLAHRVAYELAHGPLDHGQILHHDCENPGCINPAHLRPMTRADHVRHHLPRKGTGKCRS